MYGNRDVKFRGHCMKGIYGDRERKCIEGAWVCKGQLSTAAAQQQLDSTSLVLVHGT